MRILSITGRLCSLQAVVGIPIDYTCSNSTPFRLGPFGGAVRSCGKSNRDLSKVSSSVHLNCRGLGGVLWILCQRQRRSRSVAARFLEHTLRRLSGHGEGAAVVLWSYERAITRQS